MNPNMRNEKLREVFEGLGFANVKTVISSGNVIFESPRSDPRSLETLIEQTLPVELGFHSTTIIRSRQQLQSLAERHPFEGLSHSSETYLFVTFLKHKPSSKPLFPNSQSYKILHIDDSVVLSLVNIDAAKTPNLMVQLEKHLGKEITSRTWKTVEKILKKFET